ncbi:MAG: hypothetical protein GWN07_20145, partial [Actinobacteria bacterium]|nr:hypothetical protein [Actinomycetota bacterium]NIU67763.1 hypothetical protein [Actinomycetota bacterium]NIW29531.1 hypothetical protein [Actinomycetota bacterium]NIX22021.1 hypothetical protein [Actinomycetota bacterium]
TTRQRAEALVDRAVAELEGFEVTTELVESRDVTDGIVARTADHDLTIIGATREGPLQRLLFGAIPQAVGRRSQNTVIMAKRNLDVTSRVRRLLRLE